MSPNLIIHKKLKKVLEIYSCAVLDFISRRCNGPLP